MVRIVPKFYFQENIVPIIDTLEDTFFISILDPDEENSSFKPFLSDSDNYLTVKFIDLVEPIGHKWADSNMFTEEMADTIVEFIMKNQDKKNCIVHCTAGVSRSGAVGEFVNDIFKYKPYQEFKRDNKNITPNVLVKKLLNNSYYKRL